MTSQLTPRYDKFVLGKYNFASSETDASGLTTVTFYLESEAETHQIVVKDWGKDTEALISEKAVSRLASPERLAIIGRAKANESSTEPKSS